MRLNSLKYNEIDDINKIFLVIYFTLIERKMPEAGLEPARVIQPKGF